MKYTGKIAPTLITSTSVLCGCMIIKMIGFIINQMFFMDKLKNLFNSYEDTDEELKNNELQNLCFNLVKNNFILELLYKPIYRGKWEINEFIPKRFSRWFKIGDKGDITIEEFINYINSKYQVYITLILS